MTQKVYKRLGRCQLLRSCSHTYQNRLIGSSGTGEHNLNSFSVSQFRIFISNHSSHSLSKRWKCGSADSPVHCWNAPFKNSTSGVETSGMLIAFYLSTNCMITARVVAIPLLAQKKRTAPRSQVSHLNFPALWLHMCDVRQLKLKGANPAEATYQVPSLSMCKYVIDWSCQLILCAIVWLTETVKLHCIETSFFVSCVTTMVPLITHPYCHTLAWYTHTSTNSLFAVEWVGVRGPTLTTMHFDAM